MQLNGWRRFRDPTADVDQQSNWPECLEYMSPVIRPVCGVIRIISHAGSVEYQYPAGVPFEPGYETHSGEDVAVYARGPMAHLFKGVREQHFVAHAMMYASCVGSNQELCNIGPESPGCPSGGQVNSASVSLVVVMILLGASFVA